MIWRRPEWRRYLEGVVVDNWGLSEQTETHLLRRRVSAWRGTDGCQQCQWSAWCRQRCCCWSLFWTNTGWSEWDSGQWWRHNLLVRVLDCWCVGLRERPLDKPVHQTSFPNSWTWNDQIDNSLSTISSQSNLLPRRWQPCSRCLTPALLCSWSRPLLSHFIINTNPSFLHFVSLKNPQLQFFVSSHWDGSEKRVGG